MPGGRANDMYSCVAHFSGHMYDVQLQDLNQQSAGNSHCMGSTGTGLLHTTKTLEDECHFIANTQIDLSNTAGMYHGERGRTNANQIRCSVNS
eukprot:364836-Chlamydomonas_euryale.AAC.4